MVSIGVFSGFKILMGHECDKRSRCDFQMCDYDHAKLKVGGNPALAKSFRRNMILNGIDGSLSIGMTSSAHSLEDVEKTAAAFDATIIQMKKEKLIK